MSRKIKHSAYHKKALEIADLVVKKQKAYGRSFHRAGQILAILYPEGIRPDQMHDVSVMVRMIDKFSRIATHPDAFGEDPREDVLGYALLWAERNRENKHGKR